MKKKYMSYHTIMNVIKKSTSNKRMLCIAVSSAVLLLAGCQEKSEINENISNTEIQLEVNDNLVSNVEEKEVVPTKEIEDKNTTSSIQFRDLTNLQFVYSSGVGAWSTLLTINEDGSFQGTYSDVDMGDAGEEYPYGIMYVSNFSGKFSAPIAINEYTDSITIESLVPQNEIGTEEIIDGIKYVYSEPYGISGAKEIYIYHQGAPVKELPEDFRSWVGYYNIEDSKDELLPFVGFYNVETKSGFSSYEVIEDNNIENNNAVDETLEEPDFTKELKELEEEADKLIYRIKNEDLTQMDYNFLTRDLYELWDVELNRIWKHLKDTLDQESMDELLQEQREWIKYKENEVTKAGAEYEGGSIRPMIEYQKAAELTKTRVYELYELIK